MFSRRLVTATIGAWLLASGCARRERTVERIAVLRFENLSPDRSTDWMGRAFAEAISWELGGARDLYAIPSVRLHALDKSAQRPAIAPGVSQEAALAAAAGANRAAYGEYEVLGGRLRGRVTVQDLATGRDAMPPIAFDVAAGDVPAAAESIARRLSANARPGPTRNPAALEAFARAVESSDAAEVERLAGAAVAADPNFGTAWLLLADMQSKRRDMEGATATIRDALARGKAMPASDRLRLEVLNATIHGDGPGLLRATAALAAAAPADPVAWRAWADSSVAQRRFADAVRAYRGSFAIEPDDTTTLNQYAYVAAYAGNFDAALDALKRYQRLRPSDPNPLDSMGDVEAMGGKLGEAERLYLEAYQKNPGFLGGADIYKAAMARLMTGDVAGADKIAAQGGKLAASPEWQWISGRRKEAYEKLAAAAPSLPSRSAQSLAYSRLAIWALLMGDRESAARISGQAAALSDPSTGAYAAVARFISLPSAPASEWSARAEKMFPSAAASLRDTALTAALLLDGRYPDAVPLLRRMEARAPVTGDRSAAIGLAWALTESGNWQEAAPLVAMNPAPGTDPAEPLTGLYFPRLYHVRAVVAERAGKADEARENRRIYEALGGK